MNSIRKQLMLSLLVGIAAALALAGGILDVRMTDALVGQYDDALGTKVRALASLVDREGDRVEFEFSEEAMPEYDEGPEAEYFCLWLEGQEKTKHSDSLDDHLDALPQRSGVDGAPETFDLELPDGRAGRALGMRFEVVDDEIEDGEILMLTIVVARSREELDAQLAELGTALGVAGVAALLFVLLCVTWSVKRGLAPIRELSDAVARVDASSLSSRVDDDGVPDELSPLAQRLNELFERLQASFDKERRMTAAMAHELRTPIAELRSASDVAHRWPDDDALVDEVLATAGDVSIRMSGAVDAVMRYCRLESGQAEPEWDTVPLRGLLDELWRPYAHGAEDRGIRFENEVPEGTAVVSDRGLLALVFGNLLNNAASFTSGTPIRAWVTEGAEWTTVHVANETDQLVRTDLAHISEPFWRKDTARSDGNHSGLGLTLVVSVSDVLGCKAGFELADQRFVASIGIPARAEVRRNADLVAQTASKPAPIIEP